MTKAGPSLHQPRPACGRDHRERTLVMRRGELIEQGRPRDILARPGHPYTQKLLGGTPCMPMPKG